MNNEHATKEMVDKAVEQLRYFFRKPSLEDDPNGVWDINVRKFTHQALEAALMVRPERTVDFGLSRQAVVDATNMYRNVLCDDAEPFLTDEGLDSDGAHWSTVAILIASQVGEERAINEASSVVEALFPKKEDR